MPGTTTNLALRKPLTTEAPDGPGQIGNLADDIETRFGRRATSSNGDFVGQLALIGTNVWRWNGSGWRLWESEWQTFNPSAGGAAFTNPSAATRMAAGRAQIEFSSSINNQGNAQVGLQGFPFPMRGGAQPAGAALLFASNGNAYPLIPIGQSSTSLAFSFQNGSAAAVATNGASAPAAWLNGNLYLSISYATDIAP